VDPDTGKLATASLSGPQAVAKASEADRKALVAVVGEAFVALAEAREAADAALTEAQGVIAAKDAELAAKDATAQELLEAKAEAEKRAAEYAGQLAAIALANPEPVEA